MDMAERVAALVGATRVRAVGEGHQSRVFEVALIGGQPAVAKVLDASQVETNEVIARVETVAELAEMDRRVCRPIRINGDLVNTITGDDGRCSLVLCLEFATGVALDMASPSDAELMGATLAGLHRSLARLAPRSIPEVAALRTVESEVDEVCQLLHGDFNSANLRRDDSTVRVFDFEDCGYGPRSFEIANALYMVLFSSTIDGETSRFPPFEDAFLTGYRVESDRVVDRHSVDRFVDLRVRALERWLDDVSTAPVGIRTASSEWLDTLRTFVSNYEPRRP